MPEDMAAGAPLSVDLSGNPAPSRDAVRAAVIVPVQRSSWVTLDEAGSIIFDVAIGAVRRAGDRPTSTI